MLYMNIEEQQIRDIKPPNRAIHSNGEEWITAKRGCSLSLAGVHPLKASHNCALMAWEALRKAIDNQQENL